MQLTVRTAKRLALGMLVAMLASCGCGDASHELPDASEPTPSCTFGDPSAPLQIEMVHYDISNQLHVTSPDDELPLKAPGQGIGDVVFLGARVTNLEGCHVTLVSSFHDVCDTVPLKVDSRPASLEDTGDGWAVTAAYSFGALQVCTNPTAKRLTQGQPFVFTVDVIDESNRRASQSITATPTCPAGADACICQCHPDYELGGTCPPGPDPVPPAC